LEEDMKRVANPDIRTPFHSLEDAINRLLPYHILAAVEPEEADMAAIHAINQQHDAEDTPAQLFMSRSDADEAVCSKRALLCYQSLLQVQAALDDYEKKFLTKSQLPHYCMLSYATSESKAVLTTLNNEIEQAKAKVEAAKKKVEDEMARRKKEEEDAVRKRQEEAIARAIAARQSADGGDGGDNHHRPMAVDQVTTTTTIVGGVGGEGRGGGGEGSQQATHQLQRFGAPPPPFPPPPPPPPPVVVKIQTEEEKKAALLAMALKQKKR
jgi:hypothetical protein